MSTDCVWGTVRGAENTVATTTKTHELQGLYCTREDRKGTNDLNLSEEGEAGDLTSWHQINEQEWRFLGANKCVRFMEKEADHGGECNYSGEKWDRGSEPVDIKKGVLIQFWLQWEATKNLQIQGKKNTLVIISEQSPWLLYHRQTLGSKAGDGEMGRWGRGTAETVQVGDGWFAWMVAMEKLRILYKSHLKFKKAILTSLNLT